MRALPLLILATSLVLGEAYAASLKGSVVLWQHGEFAPLSGHTLTVRIFSRSKQAEVASAQASTNAQGRYEFKGLNPDADNIYLLKTEFDLVDYVRGPMVFPPALQTLDLDPIQLIPSHADLNLMAADTRVTLTFGKHDLIKVHHKISLNNLSSLTFSPQKATEQPLRFGLPPGAFDFRWVSEESREAVSVERDTGVTLIKALPATTERPLDLEFTYYIAYNTSRLTLPLTSTVGWRQAELSLIDQGSVSLKSNPALKSHDGSTKLSGVGFAPTTPWEIELSGLPLKEAPFHRLLYGGLALVLLFALFLARRPSTQLSNDERYAKVLEELRHLKKQHAESKIPDDVFESEEQRLRDLAYVLLQKSQPLP